MGSGRVLQYLFESLFHSNKIWVRLFSLVICVYLLWFYINKSISLQGIEMLSQTRAFKRMQNTY